MTSSFRVGLLNFVIGGRISLLSLNELGEKSQATIILSKFVNKLQAKSYWLIVFGKYFSLIKILIFF